MIAHLWPTSIEAVNAASWIAILGGIALALLAITYTLDWIQDCMYQRAERAKRVDAHTLFAKLEGDMAQRRAQAKGGRGR